MTTVSYELLQAIHKAGFTCEQFAPMFGLTGATFSLRRKGKVPWELNKCYDMLDYLNIPRSEITQHFTGGILPQNRRWK